MADVTMNEWEVPEPADTTAGVDAWGCSGDDGADGDIDFFAAGFDEADTTARADEAANGADDLAGEAGEQGADTTAAKDHQNADTTAEADRTAKENNAGENEQAYTLKICGREQKMSLAEVLALAQKGGDYDRVRENYDSIKADAHRLQEIAAKRGKTTAELLEGLDSEERQAAQEEAVSRLVQGGLDEGVARVIGEMLTRNSPQSADSADAADLPEAADDGVDSTGGEAVRDSIKKLVDVYGISELPQEVIQMSVDKGLLPFEAYQAWKIAEGEAAQEALRRQLAAEQKNRDNGARGVGSLRGAGAGAQDAFLAGFDAD